MQIGNKELVPGSFLNYIGVDTNLRSFMILKAFNDTKELRLFVSIK